MIVTILNDSFLEDLGSTNGTLVNGQPIKKHFLQNNDVIELGKYKLKYINDTAGKTTAPQDFEKTMVLRPGAAPKPGAPATSASQAMPTMSTSSPADVDPVPGAGDLAAAAAGGAGDAAAVAAAAVGVAADGDLAGDADDGHLAAAVGVAADRGRRQGGGDPDPLRRERRQGDGAHQAAHDARQAGRAGRGDHASGRRATSSPTSRARPSRSVNGKLARRAGASARATTTSSSSPA